MKMEKIFFTVVLICMAAVGNARLEGRFTLQVNDTTGLPVANASGSIYDGARKSIIDFVTDSSGRFVSELLPGLYTLNLSAVGFQPVSRSVVMKRSGTVVILVLSPAVSTLSNVVIGTRRPVMEQKEDRLVVHLSNNLAAVGNNALSVLQSVPGVEVDAINYSIALQGRSNVIVMMDGKRMYLPMQSLIQLLQNTSSTGIERIEIIQNPGAAFDAEGGGGIIHIVMKKNARKARSLMLSSTAGYGETLKNGQEMSFQYGGKSINMFGTFSRGYNPRHIYARLRRFVTDEQLLLDQHNNWYQMPRSWMARAGVEWKPGKHFTVGSQLAYNGSRLSQQSYNQSYFLRGGVADSSIEIENFNRQPNKLLSASLWAQYQLDSASTLSVDSYISSFDNRQHVAYEGGYYSKDGVMTQPLQYRYDPVNLIDIVTLQADYTINKGGVGVESGLKSSNIRTDSRNDFTETSAGGSYRPPAFNSRFTFRENTVAGYIKLKGKWSGVEWQAGVRGEHTSADAVEKWGREKEVNSTYFRFFPSASLRFTPGKKWQVNVAYSKRINRPTYNSLNPSLIFHTPKLFYQGNPFLTPEYVHSVTASAGKGSWLLSAGYHHTSDAIVWVTYQDTALVQKSTYINAKEFINKSLLVNYSKKVLGIWTVQASANLFHNQYRFSWRDIPVHNSQLSVSLRMSHTLEAGKYLLFELGGWYNSPRYDNFLSRSGRIGQLTASIKRKIANDRGAIALSGEDIFHTSVIRNKLNYDNLLIENYARRETRQVRLSVNYTIGKLYGRSNSRQKDSEEQSRMQ